jgi:exportin-5
MDDNQKLTLLRAIAISTALSPAIIPLITPQSRSESFSTLEQFKQFDRRVDVILELLKMEQIMLPIDNTSIDVTAQTKLYMLNVLQLFLKSQYAKLNNENDRMAIRHALLLAARELLSRNINISPTSSVAATAMMDGDTRYLSVKIAALIADVATRDFPQRWTTFISDLFVPPEQGGIWYIPPPPTDGGAGDSYNLRKGYGPFTGIKICLESLKVITEDCTDGDFNSKISTARRNDVLIGLNEVHHQFIPLIFHLLSSQYAILCASKNNLMDMCKYLTANGRTIASMTVSEKQMYDLEIHKRNAAARILNDCLSTIEKFCQSMPISWMLPQHKDNDVSNTDGQHQSDCDFLAALLHLLREQTAELQVISIRCLYQIMSKKLEFQEWLHIISLLPNAISEANDVANTEDGIFAAAEGKAVDSSESLVKKYPFHLALSKMLAQSTSGYVAHITDKRVIKNANGQNHQIVSSFLSLLADLLSHPSGKICSAQSNTWNMLLRDPQLTVKSNQLLRPCLERVLVPFMDHLVRVRWDDVEELTHPHALLLEETWDDKSAYDLWLGDFRSKANILIRLIANMEPKLAATVVHRKFMNIFSLYGRGEMRDYVDSATGQLTQKSTAVMQLEGMNHPIDNSLQAMPDWALNSGRQNDPSYSDPNRVAIRNNIRAMYTEIANTVIAWNPNDCWLKFGRVTLLDSLKHFWKHDPATLPSGIDVFLSYLGEDAPSNHSKSLRDDYVSLKKKSGVALISVSKRVPHLLVPWIDQLSARVKSLLSLNLTSSTRMHLFEFLSCIATAVEDPVARSNFISNVLSNALSTLDSPMIKEAIGSPEGLLSFLGVQQCGSNPGLATSEEFVKQTTNNFSQLFSCLNQLLSVGKRCHEAARKRPNCGIPLPDNQLEAELAQNQLNFPDEGSVSINDLSVNDPFVHLWPRIFPSIIQVLEVIFTIWKPEYQGILLKNSIQRFIYAISDDEAFLAKSQGNIPNGGVFGEGGTAGSVVSGWDRRDCNLAPKWSGWFNELRHTCIQLVGMSCGQRALFSPEIGSMYPRFVNVFANPVYLKSMEHRHLSQYIKQFVEYFHLCCPSTLYQSHVAPIATHFFEHMEYRLKLSWAPILSSTSSSESTKPLATSQCDFAADVALRGGEEWYQAYYSRAGAFVGDLDAVTGEAVVEKCRVDLSRSYSDMLQTSLALKGDWNLVLANLAREEQAIKRKDVSLLNTRPHNKLKNATGPANADGSNRSKFYKAVEARKVLRIDKLCHFLLLENETIAGYLVLSISECLGYPDAYTCRRCIAISHRILETVAWVDRYTNLLGEQMFTAAVRLTVAEQKWLVGIEWDMINLVRDVYCRLVLGQYLQPGGQGLATPQNMSTIGAQYDQSKFVGKPLQGGGILCVPSDLPRQVLASLPGINQGIVVELEKNLREKRSAKEQKESIRDLLHTVAENLKASEGPDEQTGLLGRANESESLLNSRSQKGVVPSLPEKLVTHSMMLKKTQQTEERDSADYGANLFK